MKTNAWKRHNRGFTLLEVLIGIVILTRIDEQEGIRVAGAENAAA